jgi:methylenetetrahydrofolate dehydrogenase (NADP+)/methenyltetrahydrofolate cyclohydrolase
MSAKLLDGRDLAKTMKAKLKADVASFAEEHGIVPTLALVRGGEDPASVSYAKMIKRTCDGLGIAFESSILSSDTSEEEMASAVRELNADTAVHGIIVQAPVPRGVNDAVVIEALDPAKDVDGVHPLNAGRLARAAFIDRPQDIGPYFVPSAPMAGLELLKHYNIKIDGQRAVVVGASPVVGRPMSLLLLQNWATLTVCDLHTSPLYEMTREADILCSGTGVAHLIKAEMVKPGATVVDFGFAQLDGAWVGDVDFEAVKEVASAITPVPGGVGPITNVMLMRKVLRAAELQTRFGVQHAISVDPARMLREAAA